MDGNPLSAAFTASIVFMMNKLIGNRYGDREEGRKTRVVIKTGLLWLSAASVRLLSFCSQWTES